MKNINKLALILVLLLTLVFPAVAFGEDLNGDSQTNDTIADDTQEVNSEEDSETDEPVDEEVDEEDQAEGNGKGKGNGEKPWKVVKEAVEQEKDEIEALKDGLEDEIEALEASLEEAEVANDEAVITELKLQIEALKLKNVEYKLQMKSKIVEMQQIMRNKYTLEELEELDEVSTALESLENVDVIPVENVLFTTGNAKFDTPPVIKEGRTLIPVRAISEAMGATVEYDVLEKIVTITKDDKIIVFNLAEGTSFVNETETEVDVNAEVMNNRTMVPLRFIAEQLGLTVEWDQELQTISIE